MKEAQRQRYLKAMGLTPWVARWALPGAAVSPTLDWHEETDGAPAQVAVGTPVAAPQRPAAPPPAPTDAPPRAPRQPPPRPPAAEVPSSGDDVAAPARAPAAAGEALTFTLEAHLAGDTWVVFQQEDAQAPGLGRHTGALASSLLAVFGATPSRPRRFYCPLTDQPMDGEQAGQAMTAFFAGLARANGGARVLLCLEENLAAALFGGQRYRRLTLGELPALVISGLAEMLEDPPRHKGDSWRAMREHGFHGRHE